ncbi:metal-sensitive transcriptional regulator [Candidatus Roizmanbacteria bacterium]|nr:metal-sensitive transcriptional regulator [Candidatus Roizmanbacteria bacterium]
MQSEDLSKRINRLIGQLKGIEKMVDQKRECHEILQQISAVKKAIDGLSKEIVVSDICRLLPDADTKRVSQMVERAINL